jgi:two-component system response regulator LytT
MKIVIIEDEALMARDLTDILQQANGQMEVIKTLSSVAEAISYLHHHPSPDLIFSDIQLGDGLSFEIFRQVNTDCPVIFCTAYNEFALEAFRNNGIDYVLKPFSRKTIREALDKYEVLKENFTRNAGRQVGLIAAAAQAAQPSPKTTLLINWKDKIIPVRITDIALFTIDYKMTQLVTFDNQKYYLNQTLEELEQTCGPGFYRANRQYLVNKESILEALQYFARKLVLKLNVHGEHEVIISKNRVPDFLEWLKG